MFLDVVLHNSVVTVSIDADVVIMGKAEVHNAAEDSMCIRQAGNTAYDMIVLLVIQPIAIIDL